MSLHWILSLVGACTVLAAALPGAAVAEAQTAWDQAHVTAIAKELVPATDAVQDALRNEPSSIATGQARSYYRLVQTVRRIRSETKQLVAELEAGKGHDETLSVYEQLMVLLRDGREEARKTYLSSQVTEKIQAARAVLDRLAGYYDAAPLPPPLY
jgi:hypothetical protein